MDSELKKSCQQFIDGLTDVQFITFSFYYGINPKSIHLGVYEIAKALKVSPSTVYTSLESIHRKLSLTHYQPILEALSQNENETTDF